MANETDVIANELEEDVEDEEKRITLKSVWMFGIILSFICLTLQLVLYKVRPKIRKMDQKILTQLTVARLLNTLLEFLMTFFLFNDYTKDVTFALYAQTDAVLMCWMFVFTKNLYDKVVLVFTLQKWNFVILSVLIWVLTIPLGLMFPLGLNFGYFDEYYKFHAWVKFIVLAVNVLFFCRIFYVIIIRDQNSNRNFADIIKTCIISFILVCITSFQVLLTDILSYLDVGAVVADIFCLINSFQVIAVTIIFLILAKNCI